MSRGRFRDWQGPPTAQVPALDTTRLRLRCLKIADAPAAHQAYGDPKQCVTGTRCRHSTWRKPNERWTGVVRPRRHVGSGKGNLSVRAALA